MVGRGKWAISLASIGAALAMVVVSSPAAHAVSYTYTTYQVTSERDPGGVEAGARVMRTDGADRIASYVLFLPWGDELYLQDPLTDGHYAYADVKVYDTSGKLVDTDQFKTGSSAGKTYNMGTPDGSGNIPEGYKVKIRACVTGDWYCSAWVSGRA